MENIRGITAGILLILGCILAIGGLFAMPFSLTFPIFTSVEKGYKSFRNFLIEFMITFVGGALFIIGYSIIS